MDPYFELLLKVPNDFELSNKLFIRLAQLSDGCELESLSQLPREQKVVLDIWGSKGIIDNGGFRYLMESGLADIAGIADSYEAIGVQRVADAFRIVLKLFPDSKPQNSPEERLEYIGELGESALVTLNECSNVVFEADRDVLRKLAAYIRENRALFADLDPMHDEDLNELREHDVSPPLDNAPEESVIEWLNGIGAFLQEGWKGGSSSAKHHGACIGAANCGGLLVEVS